MRYTEVAGQEMNAELISKLEVAEIMIIDTIGILSSAYRYSHFAYIGGGFGTGIHNILEAATYGVPVIFGPKYTRLKRLLILWHKEGLKVLQPRKSLKRGAAATLKIQHFVMITATSVWIIFQIILVLQEGSWTGFIG